MYCNADLHGMQRLWRYVGHADTLKASTEDLQAYLLENEKSKLYNAEYEKWKNEYSYQINSEILGLD